MGANIIPFVFSTPVWGAGHVGLFLNVGLPSLLSRGNLPGLEPNPQNRYLIYTLRENEDDLENAPSFTRLAQVMPVEIIRIRDDILQPHRTMSDCHMDSLRRADEVGAAAVFLPPDCVWSDGSMVHLEALTRSGKSVVHMSGVRLDRDGFVPELAGQYCDNRAVLSLKARDLVAMGLRHLHPIALSHFWNEYEGGLMPANLVWTVAGEGLLLRCFHLHPLMVKTQIPFAKFSSTIDDDLALRACPDVSRDYVVRDSDELLAFEMSGLNHAVAANYYKGAIEGVAAWAELGANKRHRELIYHSIRLHDGSVTESVWEEKEAESRKIIDDVARLNQSSSWALLFNHPSVFIARLNAAILGRGDNATIERWLRIIAWFRYALHRLDQACYNAAFICGGSVLMTHPYWLVRRATLRAIDQCVMRDDRQVVLIGPDPGLAWELMRLHPNVTVQFFASKAKPDEALVRRGNSSQVDLLIAIDFPISYEVPAAQSIGRRRVLLRLKDDPRSEDGSYSKIEYFGGPGTRWCARLRIWGYRVREALTPQSHLALVLVKPIPKLLAPVIYSGIALIGITMNAIGLALDRFAQKKSPSHDDKETCSLELST
jgi:hypothetical protein